MKRKWPIFLLPAGLLIFLAYQLWERLVAPIPDAVALPMMIVSILLMLGGIAVQSYRFGKWRSQTQTHSDPATKTDKGETP